MKSNVDKLPYLSKPDTLVHLISANSAGIEHQLSIAKLTLTDRVIFLDHEQLENFVCIRTVVILDNKL